MAGACGSFSGGGGASAIILALSPRLPAKDYRRYFGLVTAQNRSSSSVLGAEHYARVPAEFGVLCECIGGCKIDV
jgi:hypothetical protein